MKVKVQQMFPNCRKYDKCCKDNKKFWKDLGEKTKVIGHRNQSFRISKIKLEFVKPPKDFIKW